MARPVKHGTKWRVRWLDANGVRQSAVYDDFNTAAHELRKKEIEAESLRQRVRDGGPPLTSGRRTLGDAFDYWLEHRAPHKRSGDDDRSMIRRHLRPVFGELPLAALNQAHIDAYRDTALKSVDGKTIDNHLTLLLACVRHAHRLGWLAVLPPLRKPKKIKAGGTKFRYLKSADEVRRFLAAAREEPNPVVFVLYATAVFSGLRAGELAGLTWDNVDLDARRIHVVASYDGPPKDDDARVVVIVDDLLPILRAWRKTNPLNHVFPSEAGKMLGPSARIFQETLHRVLKNAGFPARVTKRGNTRGYIVFHDLRHTFASHWMMSGGQLYKLQRLLGHSSEAMTQRYAHLSPDAYSEDFGRMKGLLASASVGSEHVGATRGA